MSEESSEPQNEETLLEETSDSEKFDVIYSCLRCGTNVPNTELSRLPEIKCICGFRVFTKNRPPIVKTVKAI
ncbi:MAG: RNA polymerase Rbp10 [Nitrosopumilaceae archaeon]